MKGGFGGRQGEDQPAVAGVHGRQLEHVPKKGPVRFRILGVEDDVGAVDHCLLSWAWPPGGSSSHRGGEFASGSENQRPGLSSALPSFFHSLPQRRISIPVTNNLY